MPQATKQLTLFSDPSSRNLSLSPTKPTTHQRRESLGESSKANRIKSYTKRGDSPNLWELHHIQEDMVAARKAGRGGGGGKQVEAKAEGKEDDIQKEVEDQDEAEEARGSKATEGEQHDHMDPEGDRAKGQPGKKRKGSPEGGGVAGKDAKKSKNAYEIKGKVATAEDAARVDSNPPLDQLMKLLKDKERKKKVEKGESVVYWMRMEDMRIADNTAFAHASQVAQDLSLPLVVLFVFSPGDYKFHDRGSRRIDFMLRTLKWLKPKFDDLNIPLYLFSHDKRLSIPRRLVNEVFPHLKTNHVFANIEYEVDELRRDIATVKLGREKGIDVVCLHDRLVVPPGRITSQAGKPMSVFSPWQRAWARIVEAEPNLLELSPDPKANDAGLRKDKFWSKIFDECKIPETISGFELENAEKIYESWPEGTDAAKELLDRFLHTKPRKEQFKLTSPLNDGAVKDDKNSRIKNYQTGRNLVDADNSSRLSPYLASGVISGRMVLAEAKKIGKGGKLESGRDSGIGMWVQEVSWRDFYNHVMCTWPRVSMGRPFLEKFADVQWEVNEDHLQAWKDGKTGYPIVDAAMRACKARGWMENRVRMTAACFLVKDLMLDWREWDSLCRPDILGLGEKHFMESFIDGDLAANNGGWQWTASTGTDPQPYFRIFNPLNQSEKADPNGDYIRYWVPELKHLKGKAVHDPFHNMPKNEFKKLGYPEPIVDHKEARERALFRYKNPGEK